MGPRTGSSRGVPALERAVVCPQTVRPAHLMEPEATYQQQAEQDARRFFSDLRECAEGDGSWCVKVYDDDARLLLDALAVAERERDQARKALRQIAEIARWYANNGQRLQLEVDHALCVEVLDLAERGGET